MQKELEFPASFCGLQEKKKNSVKDMVHAPIPPAIHFFGKDDSYITASQKFWSQYLAAELFFFLFFSLRSGNQGSDRHHRIHFISHAASAPAVVILWGLRMTPRHFVVIFNIKYPLRDYLMFCSVYSPPPPTCFSLNARQIEHLSWLLHLKEPSSILHSML